jgi:hypothetical protein
MKVWNIALLLMLLSTVPSSAELETVWKNEYPKVSLNTNSFICREVQFMQSGFRIVSGKPRVAGYTLVGKNEGVDTSFKVKFVSSEKVMIDNDEYTVIKTPGEIVVALRPTKYGMTMAVFDFEASTMSYTSNNVAPLLGMGNRVWLTRCSSY